MSGNGQARFDTSLPGQDIKPDRLGRELAPGKAIRNGKLTVCFAAGAGLSLRPAQPSSDLLAAVDVDFGAVDVGRSRRAQKQIVPASPAAFGSPPINTIGIVPVAAWTARTTASLLATINSGFPLTLRERERHSARAALRPSTGRL